MQPSGQVDDRRSLAPTGAQSPKEKPVGLFLAVKMSTRTEEQARTEERAWLKEELRRLDDARALLEEYRALERRWEGEILAIERDCRRLGVKYK